MRREEAARRIRRGDIYYAELDPVRGSEQGGVRPVLILQNDQGNRYGPTVIVAPITSHGKKYYLPTHIRLPGGTRLPRASMILLEQLRTIDKCRLGEYVGHLGQREMERLRGPLGISVGLELLEQEPPELLLCLCPTCAKEFCNAPGYIVRRADPLPRKAEVCTYCGVRKGYDYWIVVNNQK